MTAAVLAALVVAPQAAVAAPARPAVSTTAPLTVAQLLERFANEKTEVALDPIDEDALDRMLCQDLADFDEDAGVRAAAQAALDTNDPVRIRDFLDNGLPVHRDAANIRKKIVATENRTLVQGWAQTGTPTVRQKAAAALATNNDAKIADFVAIGKAAAEAADKQQTINEAEQAKTIKARVEQIVAHGGYEVRATGTEALESEDPAVIAAFYNTGYTVASQHDADAQKQIEEALATRAKATADLADLAERSTRAANARTTIIRASVASVQALTITSNSMGLVNKYAKQADRIYAADIPIRKAGGATHTAQLSSLRSQACAEYQVTARNADTVSAQAAVADTAAQTLVATRLSVGVDWSQVMLAQDGAGTAAKQAAETACHAAEATEAAGKTLDADRNATVEANNAVKYRQAAEREQAAAEKLADRAEALAAAAKAAEADAKAQRIRAEQKANEAWVHADNAEDHYYAAREQRDIARRATAVAVQQQLIARDAANRAITQQNIAQASNDRAKPLYDDAVAARDRFGQKALQAQGVLERAKKSYAAAKSKELEAQAAEARKIAMEINCKNPDRPSGTGCPGPEEEAQIRRDAERLSGEATIARNASDAAQGDSRVAAAAVTAAAAAAQQAAAAASAAAAEARAAANEAKQAHAAATASANAAGAAIADAKRANDLAAAAVNTAQSAINRAIAARADAQATARAAEESGRQAGIAQFQSRVAGRAAIDARTAAAGIAEPAEYAIDAASLYAETDNDAAMAIAIASNAMVIGEEQSAAAQKHAEEADKAAEHAAEQATNAQAQIKPAFVAAQKAADAAARAVKASKVAVDAANGATREAQAATVAAQNAARADQYARQYADAAGQMAAQAGNDAATARQAYNSARAFSGTAAAAAENAGKFATNVENMHKSAVAMANTVHSIAMDIGRMPDNLEKAMWEAYGAEQQARETAWLRWLKEQGDKALSKMPWGGDIAKGALESALGNAQSMWLLGNCAFGPNTPSGDAWSVPDVSVLPNSEKACTQLIQGVKEMFKNPGDLIHLDLWKENWQKALGMSLVDFGSLAIPGFGAAGKAIKAGGLKGLGKLLKDDLTAASLLFGRESIENAVKKLGSINVARLLNIIADTKLKFTFTPDELSSALKAITVQGIDKVENSLRGLGDSLPSLPALKDLIKFCVRGNSFTADTLVLLDDGSTRPIGDIRVGDAVRATDPYTGGTSSETVGIVHRNQDTALADVVVAGGTIRTTEHHLFWSETNRDWVEAGRLVAGQRLSGGTAVSGVRVYSGTQTMYDLTVDPIHTFSVVVGGTPVLVHNETPCNLMLGARDMGTRDLALQISRDLGTKIDDYLDMDPDSWFTPVDTAIKNPGTTLHVNLRGFTGSSPMEQFLLAAKEGKVPWSPQHKTKATQQEMKLIVQAVISGKREWSSVVFYDERGNRLPQMAEPDWQSMMRPPGGVDTDAKWIPPFWFAED